MRYVELELECAQALNAVLPPLRDVLALARPDDEHVIICDRPDGATPRLSCVASGGAREIRLDAPGFLPRLLVDTDDARVLAIGRGENSGVLFDPTGRVLRRYNLGEGIVDATFDADGNIVVLRGQPPLLDRYGPDGDLVDDDAQLLRIQELTTQHEGSMLLIQRDGTLWLNLAERYDADGELIDAIEPAEVFSAGHVAADLLGWDGIVVLNEEGRVVAATAGGRRAVRVPEADVQRELGRGLSAAHDLLVTREERLWVLDTAGLKLLTFRILSE